MRTCQILGHLSVVEGTLNTHVMLIMFYKQAKQSQLNWNCPESLEFLTTLSKMVF